MIDPMVDDNVDLRSYDFMPLKVSQLRNSDLAAEAEPEAFRAAVLLWCSAWHEIPAASLPDDDRKLCRLAGLHRDLATWERIKKEAMRGFELCSDGRWYHPLIADLANEAWSKKKRNAARTANATLARQRARSALGRRDDADLERNVAKKATKGQGQGEGQGYGEGQGSSFVEAKASTPDEIAVAISMWNRMAERIKIPKVMNTISETRRTKVRNRLDHELGGLEGWAELLKKIEESPHLRGENRQGWTATFDWVLEPRNLTKVMEGNYARRPGVDRKSGFAADLETFSRGPDKGDQRD